MQEHSSSPPAGGPHHHHHPGASIPAPPPPRRSLTIPPLPKLRRGSLLSYCAGAAIGVGTSAAAFGVDAIAASPALQAGALGIGAATLIGAGLAVSVRADRADRELRAVVNALEAAAARVDQALTALVPGRHPHPPFTLEAPGLANLAAELERVQYLVDLLHQTPPAPTPATSTTTAPEPPRRRDHVAILVNLARRLQVRIHHSILEIEELERHVEDPNLMKSLYDLDLHMTILRRWLENLVILGGGPLHRQWTRPVRISDVVRAAIAEVEKFARVTPVPPIEGTLNGNAVADVNHLLADLIENATNFSAPSTKVEIKASHVRSGAAVEIIDRGLGIKRREDLERLNALLKNPDAADVEGLLASGRIGLYVVAILARQHAITVELQTNIFGGTTAVVILPPALLGKEPRQDTAVPQETPQETPAVPLLELTAAPTRPAEPLPAHPTPALDTRPALPQRTTRPRPAHDDQPHAGRTASEGDPNHALWSQWTGGLNGSDSATPATHTEES